MVSVSVVMSVWNEASRLPAALNRIARFRGEYPEISLEVIVVDDGSTDGTWDIIQRNRVINLSKRLTINQGKGRGLREGTRLATNNLVYLCDVDFSSPIEELLRFLAQREHYDLLVGSRALRGSQVKTAVRKRILGRTGNCLIRLFLGLRVTDTQCGFKLLNRKARDVFLRSTINRWGFDFELLFLASRDGLRVKELAVTWTDHPDSRVRSLDYVKTLVELLGIWWRYRIRSGIPKAH